ncbi:hypothetical protein QZM18_28730 [Burkholderia diffusa]|nr:hypothetical protein [Burkholderia diffusa]MDN7908076.1 hypothetical protein [Burkholderia diffusa]
MHERDADRAGQLRHAADIAGRCNLGDRCTHRRDLAPLQFARDLGLQQVVDTGRSATHEAVQRLDDVEPRVAQQVERRMHDPLTVLHRARRVIDDPQPRDDDRWLQAELHHEFGNVLRERADARRLVFPGRIEPQRVTVHRSTTVESTSGIFTLGPLVRRMRRDSHVD